MPKIMLYATRETPLHAWLIHEPSLQIGALCEGAEFNCYSKWFLGLEVKF